MTTGLVNSSFVGERLTFPYENQNWTPGANCHHAACMLPKEVRHWSEWVKNDEEKHWPMPRVPKMIENNNILRMKRVILV
jgi:hypothetical protein